MSAVLDDPKAAARQAHELNKLSKQGVKRVILPLPTRDESKVLSILDSYAPLIANRPRD